MQATIESNRQEYDEKIKKLTEDLKSMITSTITSMMYQINISKYLPDQKDPLKDQNATTVVPVNGRAPPLDGGHYKKLVACGL